MTQRLKIAIQKKGRLNNDSVSLLSRCGLKFRISNNSLISRCENLPIDILLVRDDDIPTMVMDNVCNFGIVGENILFEKELAQKNNANKYNLELVIKLGFGNCRLSIACPEGKDFSNLTALQNLRIATSYPNILNNYLSQNNVSAEVFTISGSVEITPRLGMADVICDLVSTGRTLEENNLKEIAILIKSQAVLIRSKNQSLEEKSIETLLIRRIKGVTKAQESKYILFHAPKSALEVIKGILPGFETPTIMPLEGSEDKVAIHLVSRERIFWDTLEKLKQAGASSILVLPIEKMMS